MADRRVLAIGLVTVHDPARYRQYARAFTQTLLPYGGELIAAGTPDLIEGRSTFERIVIARFPDRTHFDRWYGSPEYQAIVADRRAATTATVLCVDDATRAPGQRTA